MRATEFLTEALDQREIYEIAYHDIEKVFREVATDPQYFKDGGDYRDEIRWMLKGRLQGLIDALYRHQKIQGIDRVPLVIYPQGQGETRKDGIVHDRMGAFHVQTAYSAVMTLHMPPLPSPEYGMAFQAAFIRGRDGGEYKDAIHRLARTFTHEFMHATQYARVGRDSVRRDPDDPTTMHSVSRAMHRRDLSKYDRKSIGWFKPEDSWHDPIEKIQGADYMTQPAETEAHAINTANDLVQRETPRNAMKRLAWFLQNPQQIPDHGPFHSLYAAYRVLRKNPYLDTETAWKRFLKKVYQHLVRIEEYQEKKRKAAEAKAKADAEAASGRMAAE